MTSGKKLFAEVYIDSTACGEEEKEKEKLLYPHPKLLLGFFPYRPFTL